MFTSVSCKFSLINYLVDRLFTICNNLKSFLNDIENIKSKLIKNAYSPFLIDKVIKKYISHKSSNNQNQLKKISNASTSKLSHIGNLSHHTKNKFSKLKEFCKENFKIKVVFTSFKIKSYF